jgi:hypothetical protein
MYLTRARASGQVTLPQAKLLLFPRDRRSVVSRQPHNGFFHSFHRLIGEIILLAIALHGAFKIMVWLMADLR